MDDADPDDTDGPGVTLTVRLVQLAGVLWVGHGALFLAAATWLCAEGGFGGMCAAAILIPLGVVFALAGLATAGGRTRGPDVLGAWSVAVGLLALAAGVTYGARGRDERVAAAVGGYGVALVIPGAPAMAGGRAYRAWRARQYPPTR